MKKTLTLILLCILTVQLFAPYGRTMNALLIIKEEPIREKIVDYTPLIDAITWVEVKEGTDLYNEIEKAVGWFQIRPIRVRDYNKRTGSHYKLADFFDYELSKQMFLYYAKGKTFEQASKDWNGSGPMTIEYWNKVKARLYE